MLYNALRLRNSKKLLLRNAFLAQQKSKASVLAPTLPFEPMQAAVFDEGQHIVTDGPSQTFALSDFGYDAAALNVPDFAATEPFRLLTPSAVETIKEELNANREACTYSYPPFAPCVMRGLAHKSSFINDLWSSAAIRNVLSKASGVDLEAHPMLFERGHVNVQKNPSPSTPEELAAAAEKEQKPVFGWHTDSQPYVCIVLLSDPPEDAMGGQTYVKKADGEIVKLSFPKAGYAYLLQGSVIPHAAMPALNYQRETMITSFVPSDAKYPERTDLDLAINYSPLKETLQEFIGHKRNYLAKRLSLLTADNLEVRKEDVERIEKAIDDIIEDLAHTRRSMQAVKRAVDVKGANGTRF